MKDSDIDRIIEWYENSEYSNIYDMLEGEFTRDNQIAGFLAQYIASGKLTDPEGAAALIKRQLAKRKLTRNARGALKRAKPIVREAYVKEKGETRVSKPPDITQKEWNKQFVKVGGQKVGRRKLPSRNVNLTPANTQLIIDGKAAGKNKTNISRDIAKADLVENGVKRITKSKIDSRARQYRDLVTLYEKEHP